jgi:hypothetical protein
MRATVDWSYRLLSSEQQQLFQWLAVFAGTFDLHAAEHVGGATPAGIAALLDRSFLTVERHPTGTRHRMLETLRQYAEPTGHRAHAEYFRDRAERIDADRIATGCDARIADLVPDADNYRAALAWSSEHAPETALRLAAALEGFWMIRSVAEGQRWLRQALEQASMPSVYRARALMVLPLMVGDGGGHLPESLRLYQDAGDDTGATLAQLTTEFAGFAEPRVTFPDPVRQFLAKVTQSPQWTSRGNSPLRGGQRPRRPHRRRRPRYASPCRPGRQPGPRGRIGAGRDPLAGR